MTPVVSGRKYLPLHPVSVIQSLVLVITFRCHFFVAHSPYPIFWGLITMEGIALWLLQATNRVTAHILTPFAADRKYPPLNTVTGTRAKHRCLQHIAHYIFFFFRRTSWPMIARPSNKSCCAKLLSSKIWKLVILRLAAITNFKEYDMIWYMKQRCVKMLTSNGIDTDLQPAWCNLFAFYKSKLGYNPVDYILSHTY